MVENEAGSGHLGVNERAIVMEAVDDLYKSLSPVRTTGGVDLTTLLSNPANGVKVFGLSNNKNAVGPMAAVVPAGVLPVGTPLSLAVPVVLSPEGDGVQRMVVTDARHLFTRPDGGGIYVLKSYCLDLHADAPTMEGSGFRFSMEDQAILTPRVRDALKAGRMDTLQRLLWDIREGVL